MRSGGGEGGVIRYQKGLRYPCGSEVLHYHLFLVLILNTLIISNQYYPIYRCTVRVLWDLWWFGDASKNMGPFSSHISSDYVIRRHQSYLSGARVVINKIEALLKVKEPNLVLKILHITEIRAKFSSGFDDLCSYLSLGQTIEELDRRHYGDAMYVSFYKRL